MSSLTRGALRSPRLSVFPSGELRRAATPRLQAAVRGVWWRNSQRPRVFPEPRGPRGVHGADVRPSPARSDPAPASRLRLPRRLCAPRSRRPVPSATPASQGVFAQRRRRRLGSSSRPVQKPGLTSVAAEGKTSLLHPPGFYKIKKKKKKKRKKKKLFLPLNANLPRNTVPNLVQLIKLLQPMKCYPVPLVSCIQLL